MNTQGDKHLSTCFPLPECPVRKSFDKLTNTSGTQLLQLCRTLGLHIVNYEGTLWVATLTAQLLAVVRQIISLRIQIQCLSELSQSAPSHPSQTTAKSLYLKRVQSNSGAPSACKLFNSTYSYRWTPDNMGAYHKALENQNIHDLTNLFLTEPFPHNNSESFETKNGVSSVFKLQFFRSSFLPFQSGQEVQTQQLVSLLK